MTTDWYTYPSNFSNNTGVNSISDYYQYINFITGDWFATGFVILIWVLSFGFSMMLGVRKALMSSSFIAFIFSIYFYRVSLVGNLLIILSIIGVIIGAIGSKEESSL